MIEIACPMAGQHEKKEPRDFPLNPFEEDRATCPGCKWETTPEWEFERMYRFIEASGGSREDRSLTEMRNCADWLILQCLERSQERELNLQSLARDAASYITNKRCPQLKDSIHDWVFTEQFRKALFQYAGCEVDSQWIVKPASRK